MSRRACFDVTGHLQLGNHRASAYERNSTTLVIPAIYLGFLLGSGCG